MQSLLHMPYNFCTGSGHSTSATPMSLGSSSNSSSRGGNEAAAVREMALARCLVAKYLDHTSLWQQQPGHLLQQLQTDPLTAEVLQALLALTDEYERRYKSQLGELSASWDISLDSPRVSFTEVLDTVFLDGCNWGRVVTLFIFIGLFLRKCQQQRDSVPAAAAASVEDVADWSVAYLHDRLGPWIREQGGWMGLVHFYREGDTAGAQLASEGRVFKRLLTVAGAGLALLSLGSLLTNRA